MKFETFLPKSWFTQEPKYIVWFTGTLGQAEWLISYSNCLRKRAIPRNWNTLNISEKSESNKESQYDSYLKRRVNPLFALEDPDLVISDIDGNPLISIEITEQQPFGSNGQQRMARFWSAAANKVPSLYLLPLEGYQIEKIEPTSQLVRYFKDKNSYTNQLFLEISQIPSLRLKKVKKIGVNNLKTFLKDYLKLAKSMKLTTELQIKFQKFIEHHFLEGGNLDHVRYVEAKERVHELKVVGTQPEYHKTYIREPGDPGVMLLKWFQKINPITPSALFHYPTDYENLFRSNGIKHLIEDLENPHLSYRNLPPKPGSSKPYIKGSKYDEISLFFKMIDETLSGESANLSHRNHLYSNDEFHSDGLAQEFRKKLYSGLELLNAKSGDFKVDKSDFIEALKLTGMTLNEFQSKYVDLYANYSVMKIRCEVQRGLGDPYSGKMAVRDILFTRNLTNLNHQDLLSFKRETGFILWVDLVGTASKKHDFISKKILKISRDLELISRNDDTQKLLIKIAKNIPASQVPKDIRAHLLFPNVIVVRRKTRAMDKIEFLIGISSLMQTNIINKSDVFMKSLSLDEF